MHRLYDRHHGSREMSVRFSLKTVLRDCVIMLCGTVLGILLAQGFMTSHRTAIAHLTKREHPLAVSVKSTERPKTIASELNVSSIQPLYIGVVTAQNLLSTRAAAVNHTWGQKAPKLEFFSSLDHADSTLGLPIVSLDGVDDTYPPQKKVFRMLKYMYDHYINEYNWFMRADDDVYVCVEHLMHFLSKLDPSRILYIGQPGGGKPQDLARIKMKPHEHYCMGGPGVIFSRALLIKLAPHLEDCLEHEVVSWNEDLEVGRCISRRLGVQCTWNYEMSQLFVNDYSKGDIFKSPDVYDNQKLRNALTVHSFKDPDMMYRIHQYYVEIAISTSLSRTEELRRDLQNISKLTKRKQAFA